MVASLEIERDLIINKLFRIQFRVSSIVPGGGEVCGHYVVIFPDNVIECIQIYTLSVIMCF